MTTNYKYLRKPIDRIHFAGTEHAIHFNGYMSGACESAERCVNEIYQKIKE
jgi:monoamine oxidase